MHVVAYTCVVEINVPGSNCNLNCDEYKRTPGSGVVRNLIYPRLPPFATLPPSERYHGRIVYVPHRHYYTVVGYIQRPAAPQHTVRNEIKTSYTQKRIPEQKPAPLNGPRLRELGGCTRCGGSQGRVAGCGAR
ncbi:hypothetical protein K1T71_002759 [Dendrolimus kikuchii]|uniref:Uncharacterized protein n=1 Tax=Dendrolimus kikuchii TaxID=765133 RepID=A0ACC1DEL0_9NEOP|nr:hypothetical protein K1T71_002759 [Dendrolimus kikuchii]